MVRMLGIQSARELPVSFPELIFMHEDLRNLIDSLGNIGKGQTRNKHAICLEEAIVENVDQGMCESEKNSSKEPKAVFDGFQLSQHCAELVLNNFKDPNGVSRVSSLLASLGNVEKALCQAYDVSTFADFGLKEGLFSEFLGRYGLSLAEGLGVDGHFPTITRFLKLCPSASPQQVAKHFLGFSEKELQKAMQAQQESQTAPEAVKVDSRPRELQVLMATCGWDTGAQQHAHPRCLSDEHRADLVMKAVEAIEQVPVLMDLHEALPEWNKKFLPLGSLVDFLASDEIRALARGGLPPLQVIEVRCGQLVRLTDGSFSTLQAALMNKDPRKTAASIISRLLADGEQAPVYLRSKA